MTTNPERYEVFEVGFPRGKFPTLDEATAQARRCCEYAYIVDHETGQRHEYGGRVSG